MGLSLIDRLREPVLASFARPRSRLEKVYVWEPLPVVCPDARCCEYGNNGPIFFDADHLSGLGDRLLEPSFERFILQLSGTSRSVPDGG
jgi:hypothetical protein